MAPEQKYDPIPRDSRGRIIVAKYREISWANDQILCYDVKAIKKKLTIHDRIIKRNTIIARASFFLCFITLGGLTMHWFGPAIMTGSLSVVAVTATILTKFKIL